MSFQFDLRGDESPAEHIQSVVFQAIGAASTCWERVDLAGEFDSSRARDIGLALIRELGL